MELKEEIFDKLAHWKLFIFEKITKDLFSVESAVENQFFSQFHRADWEYADYQLLNKRGRENIFISLYDLPGKILFQRQKTTKKTTPILFPPSMIESGAGPRLTPVEQSAL